MLLLDPAPAQDTYDEHAYLLKSPMDLSQFHAELAAEVDLSPDRVAISVSGDPRSSSERNPSLLLVAPRSIRPQIVARVAAKHTPSWG